MQHKESEREVTMLLPLGLLGKSVAVADAASDDKCEWKLQRRGLGRCGGEGQGGGGGQQL